MISSPTAQALQKAGLTWEPALHDLFTIPGSSLEDRQFVLSDVSAFISVLQGHPAITFHGAVEWAMDHVWMQDAVWLPSETQLRQILEHKLLAQPNSQLFLNVTIDGYVCQIQYQNAQYRFEAFGAEEAYAQALLFLLEQFG